MNKILSVTVTLMVVMLLLAVGIVALVNTGVLSRSIEYDK